MKKPASLRIMAITEGHSVNIKDASPWITRDTYSNFGFGDDAGAATLGYKLNDSEFSLDIAGASVPSRSGEILSCSRSGMTFELEQNAAKGNFQKRVTMTAQALKDLGGIVSFPLKTNNLTFHKQPYLVGGPSPTNGYERNENQAEAEGFSSRSAEICGGYAVYDGKINERLASLTRPHIFFNNVEGLKDHPDFPGYPIPVIELDITETTYSYVVDPTWLASIGSGRIIIDPELGYTSIGATNGFDTARVNYGQFTEGGSAGSYDTFFVYNGSDTTPTEIGTAVYTDSAGAPNTLTQCGTPITGVTGWGSAAIPTINTSSSEIVWLAFQAGNGIGGTDMLDPRYDLTGGIHEQANPGTYVICADPANRVSTTTGTRHYSVYLLPAATGGIIHSLAGPGGLAGYGGLVGQGGGLAG